MNEVKEYWIDIPNKYIMEMKPDFIHAKYYIHVVEASSYQSLQEKYDRAVKGLKEIYADGSYTDIAAEIATETLKELGEL